MSDGTAGSSAPSKLGGGASTTRSSYRVPAYLLYGDADEQGSFGFFHIEPLAVRNEPNAWRISLHNHPELVQFSITFGGECTFEHDGVTRTVEGPCCVFTPADVVHRFSYQPGTAGFVISASPDFLSSFTMDCTPMKGPLARIAEHRVAIWRDSSSASRVQALVEVIAQIFESAQANRMHALRHLCRAWLVIVNDALDGRSADNPEAQRGTISTADLFARFIQTLEAQMDVIGRGATTAPSPLTVEGFAAQLLTTAYALNAACRRSAGRSARSILQAASLDQATRLLLYSDQPIKQIAYTLGYSHPSHFVRFFKQNRGKTPEAFRLKSRNLGVDIKP